MVKTQGCGSCIRGFESHYPPHFKKIQLMLGYRQAVRQRILIPSFAGSNPATLAQRRQKCLRFSISDIPDLCSLQYKSFLFAKTLTEKNRYRKMEARRDQYGTEKL